MKTKLNLENGNKYYCKEEKFKKVIKEKRYFVFLHPIKEMMMITAKGFLYFFIISPSRSFPQTYFYLFNLLHQLKHEG